MLPGPLFRSKRHAKGIRHQKHPTEAAWKQAEYLWHKILQAKGHQGDFRQWIFDCADHIQEKPDLEYATHIAQYLDWHKKNEHDDLIKTKLRQIELDEDMERGGALTYKKIREPQLPPIQAR